MSPTLIVIALVGVAVFSALRVVSQWRGMSRRRGPVDWDERFIQQLRKAGINAFEENVVDFFFTVPERSASELMAAVLRGEGFAVDIKHSTDGADFSLHAQRSMRLVVAELQAIRARFNALAGQHGASYDSWAVGAQQ